MSTCFGDRLTLFQKPSSNKYANYPMLNRGSTQIPKSRQINKLSPPITYHYQTHVVFRVPRADDKASFTLGKGFANGHIRQSPFGNQSNDNEHFARCFFIEYTAKPLLYAKKHLAKHKFKTPKKNSQKSSVLLGKDPPTSRRPDSIHKLRIFPY